MMFSYFGQGNSQMIATKKGPKVSVTARRPFSELIDPTAPLPIVSNTVSFVPPLG